MKSLRPILLACLAASWGSLAHAQSTWQVEQIAEERADDVSIEVDAQGNPHVGYRAYGAETHLKYVQRLASAWSVEHVDTKPNVGLDVSLRLDSSGQPKFAYADPQWPLDPAVKYAERSGSGWALQEVNP